MKKQFAILVTMVFFGAASFGQVPSKQKSKKKKDTTSVRKSVPKPEKYDPNAHKWPKKDSLKSIESRKDSVRKPPASKRQ